ncbi:MAG: hypothetical protein ACLGP3_08495 [Acidobacteriota bacterium]
MSGRKPPSQPGCTWDEDCIEMCTGRSVYVEEDGVRATFANRKRKQIRKIHYDGCYYTGRDRRADYIVGLPGTVDVIVELKGTDTNLKGAAQQVENTLGSWQQDKKHATTIASLIVYGRIEGKKKLPGRVPRAEAAKSSLRAAFLRAHGKLLLIHQNGEKRFSFEDFLR